MFKTSQWLEGIGQEQAFCVIDFTRFFGDLGIRTATGQIFGF